MKLKQCPTCGMNTFDGEVCTNCGYDEVELTGSEDWASAGYGEKLNKMNSFN